MEKHTAEKATDVSMLNKMLDPIYFFVFGSFGLFWDSVLHLSQSYGLLQLAYPSKTPFPVGVTFLAIGAFSFLAAIVVPVVHGVLNNLFWDIAIALPFPIYFEAESQNPKTRCSNVVRSRDLKLWAIKEKNSQAMDLVKQAESRKEDAWRNSTYPFLLSTCLLFNYLVPTESVTHTAQAALTAPWQDWFSKIIIGVSLILAYLSFTSLVNKEFDIILPGLSDLIKK